MCIWHLISQSQQTLKMVKKCRWFNADVQKQLHISSKNKDKLLYTDCQNYQSTVKRDWVGGFVSRKLAMLSSLKLLKRIFFSKWKAEMYVSKGTRCLGLDTVQYIAYLLSTNNTRIKQSSIVI